MTWWDIVKFENRLGTLIDNLTHHHNTSLARQYISNQDRLLAERLFKKITQHLNNPDLFDTLDKRGNPIADPMNSYYSLLIAAPEMHHRDFGHLYEALFEELEKLRRLYLKGDGVGV